AQVAVRRVHRAATAVEDHPPLTAAIDEYVGEPREPAEPYRPPVWMRMSPPAWMVEPEADPLGALAGMSIPTETETRPPLTGPRPRPMTQWPEPDSGLPIPGAAPPDFLARALPGQPPPSRQPTVPGRPVPPRPSLGEARRPGLGTPI